MFILVQRNTSLHKNYVAHSYVTVVCVRGWIWEKNGFVRQSVLSGCLCIWSQLYNKDFSTNSHSTTKRLKHSSNFESDENVRSWTSSNSYWNFRHIPICSWCRMNHLAIGFEMQGFDFKRCDSVCDLIWKFWDSVCKIVKLWEIARIVTHYFQRKSSVTVVFFLFSIFPFTMYGGWLHAILSDYSNCIAVTDYDL